MKTTYKKIKFLPVLQSDKYKFLFVAINTYLMVGVGSLLFTILYLLFNLSNLDSIIYYCIPGFVVFLSAALFYIIGYQTMMSEQKDKQNAHKHHMG